MKLDISRTGDVTTIALKGRIDATVASDVEQELVSLISGGSCRLVTALAEVTFISSAGLRSLVAALKQAKREKGDLRLAEMGAKVKEVFEITGLSTVFSIYATAEEAIRSFGD
jgi:anti-sigma B factor antagonist